MASKAWQNLAPNTVLLLTAVPILCSALPRGQHVLSTVHCYGSMLLLIKSVFLLLNTGHFDPEDLCSKNHNMELEGNAQNSLLD